LGSYIQNLSDALTGGKELLPARPPIAQHQTPPLSYQSGAFTGYGDLPHGRFIAGDRVAPATLWEEVSVFTNSDQYLNSTRTPLRC
jgi:hypothetical protein